jgi:hypothetical protein
LFAIPLTPLAAPPAPTVITVAKFVPTVVVVFKTPPAPPPPAVPQPPEPPPAIAKTSTEYPRRTVPVVAGNVIMLVPATAGTSNVMVPDVLPAITTELIYFPYKTTQR